MNKKSIIYLTLLGVASFSLVGCSMDSLNDEEEDKEIISIFNKTEGKEDSEIKKDDEVTSIFGNNNKDEVSDNTQPEVSINNTNDNTLKSFSENVSLKYPASWTLASFGDSNVYYVDDTQSTNANLVKESLQGYSEEEYKQASMVSVKESFGANMIFTSDDTFNGHNGYTLDYETEVEGQKIRLVQPTVFYDGDAYIFTLGGFPDNVDKQVDEFKEIINTIEFK